MEYVIWGAGERGARLFPHLNADEVEAFIDIDEKKIGKYYCGKKIISFEEYKANYAGCYIVISYTHENEVVSLLKRNEIYRYFLMTECPGEFQESYPRDILKNYISEYLKESKRYVIYGCTLYSLILGEWLAKNGQEHITIVPHAGVKQEFIESLQKDMPDYCFCKLEELDINSVDEFLVTVEQNIGRLQNYENKNIVVTNVYDCADRIEEYYNPAIEKFKNKHQGERCFIVATGPSLRMEDLELLAKHHETCISFNSIWRAFEKTTWRPTYYLGMDYRILRDYGDIMEKQDVPYLFWGDTYEEFWIKEHAENHMKHHFAYEFSEERLPKFSEDFARKSYMGSTVTYNAIQLAVYMGFKEIYLLGVDFSNYGMGSGSYVPHFHLEEKTRSVSCSDKQAFLAYVAAKEYTDKNNISIYNASRGGKLEIFDRVDFDSLFEKRQEDLIE